MRKMSETHDILDMRNNPLGHGANIFVFLYDNMLKNELDTSGIYDPANDNHRLFVFSFDGTRNSRKEVKEDPGEKYHINPDIIQSLIADTGKIASQYYDGVVTNNDNPALNRTLQPMTFFP